MDETRALAAIIDSVEKTDPEILAVAVAMKKAELEDNCGVLIVQASSGRIVSVKSNEKVPVGKAFIIQEALYNRTLNNES